MEKFEDILRRVTLKYYTAQGYNDANAKALVAQVVAKAPYIFEAHKLFLEGILCEVVSSVNKVTDRVSEVGDDSGDKCYINESDMVENILNLKAVL